MTVTSLIVIALSLLLNALLACIEMAFVSVSRTEMRRLSAKGVTAATRILTLRENPERTLSVLQIGITLVGAISAAVGGAGAEESLGPKLQQVFSLTEQSADALAVGIVVVPLTYLSVVIGELLPKTLALRSPLRVALWSAGFLVAFDRILAPLVWILEKSTKTLLSFVSFGRVKPSAPSAADAAIPSSAELEGLPDAQREYVFNLLKLNQKSLPQILVPWSDVDTVDESWSVAELRKAVLTSGHTRLPVENNGVPVGILHAKEFMTFADSGEVKWQGLIRPALHVAATDTITGVLRLMQKSRNHMCLVSSPRGELLGVITLEGIFEEIIGEIYDEDDDGRLKRMLATNSRFRSLYSQ